MTALLRNPVVIVALAVTALVVALPAITLSHYAPPIRIALETAAALAALTAAYIVFGRFRRSRGRNDLALVVGLATLAAASSLVAVFVAVTSAPSAMLLVAMATRVVGAWTLAAAAFLSAHRVARPRRAALAAAAGVVAAVAVLSVAFLLSAWDTRGEMLGRLADAGQPHPDREWLILLFHSLSLGGFAAAAAGFARAAERTGDVFLRWVAVASALAALGRLLYVAEQPAGKYWLHSGDILVLAFFGILLFAAAQEVQGYWRGVAETAVHEERRRIARELHDGVAQELAYIARRARRGGDEALGAVAAAAERALTDSRRAIAALTLPLDEPLDRALAQATEEVAQRTGACVDLALEEGVEVSPPTREALVRIACEAVANAARHGGVDRVRLELQNGDRVQLRVRDDGVGFDPAAPRPSARGGFGLIAMRERAAALGAEFRIDSAPGAGTTVEVTLP